MYEIEYKFVYEFMYTFRYEFKYDFSYDFDLCGDPSGTPFPEPLSGNAFVASPGRPPYKYLPTDCQAVKMHEKWNIILQNTNSC